MGRPNIGRASPIPARLSQCGDLDRLHFWLGHLWDKLQLVGGLLSTSARAVFLIQPRTLTFGIGAADRWYRRFETAEPPCKLAFYRRYAPSHSLGSRTK
jgi:hypothetical protein